MSQPFICLFKKQYIFSFCVCTYRYADTCLHISVYVCATVHVRSQKTTGRNTLASFTMCVQNTELKLSGRNIYYLSDLLPTLTSRFIYDMYFRSYTELAINPLSSIQLANYSPNLYVFFFRVLPPIRM